MKNFVRLEQCLKIFALWRYISINPWHPVTCLSSWDELKLSHWVTVFIGPVSFLMLSHNWLQKSHTCGSGKICLCTSWELEAFLLRALLLWFSGPSAASCPVSVRAVGIMVKCRGVKPTVSQRTAVGLPARVSWVPPCRCALGTGAALGALWTFQGKQVLRRSSWLGLGCSQSVSVLRWPPVLVCLGQLWMMPAGWAWLINSTFFNSPECPGVFETLHSSYTWSPAGGGDSGDVCSQREGRAVPGVAVLSWFILGPDR